LQIRFKTLRKLERERLDALELIRADESSETWKELNQIRESIQELIDYKKSNAQVKFLHVFVPTIAVCEWFLCDASVITTGFIPPISTYL